MIYATWHKQESIDDVAPESQQESTETRQLFQKHLNLLIHTLKCKEINGQDSHQCLVTNCKIMRDALDHMKKDGMHIAFLVTHASTSHNNVSVNETLDTSNAMQAEANIAEQENEMNLIPEFIEQTGNTNDRNKECLLNPEELRKALLPTRHRMYMQEPESIPFRQPVDANDLLIADYFVIVKKPMDLSTIHDKLYYKQYTNPWQYVDDVKLMFDNAWLYNSKLSRVYKYCTKLSEVFEQAINPVMQQLGYHHNSKEQPQQSGSLQVSEKQSEELKKFESMEEKQRRSDMFTIETST